ncbi:MAG: hypothetical protein AAF074_22820 [Pseudomonadota bacterium]
MSDFKAPPERADGLEGWMIEKMAGLGVGADYAMALSGGAVIGLVVLLFLFLRGTDVEDDWDSDSLHDRD